LTPRRRDSRFIGEGKYGNPPTREGEEMNRSFNWAASALALLTMAGWACPAESGSSGRASAQQLRACELVDLPAARTIIGAEATNPSDTEDTTCVYVNPGVAMLSIRIDAGDLYDRLTISLPHTPQAIGEQGRSHVDINGAASVQFLQGGLSITIGVTPIGAGDAVDYLPALLSGAQGAAAKIQ